MFSKTYKRHYKRNLKLALPVVLGQVGHMLTSFADAAMVGRIGSLELAAVSLAGSLIIIPTLFAVGVSIGLTPLVGKAFGERNYKKVNSYLLNSFILNFLSVLVLTILVYFSVPFLKYLQQPADVLQLSIPYFLIINFSIIPYTLMLTAKQFTEGLEMTKPAMVVSILGNLLNIFLNYLLIFGKFGFPEMGIVGAGIASFIARTVMALSFFVFLMKSTQIKQYFTITLRNTFHLKKINELLKVGLPIGIQFTLEVGIFSVGTIMIGWFGSISLAAHHVALNLASATFLMASGLSAAATIRVSNLIGQQKLKEMRLAGFSTVYMITFLMLGTALFFILFRFQLPHIFTPDTEVINLAAKLLFVAAFFQVFDGIQVVQLGNLRGMADVKFPTYVALFSYWIIGIPSCYLFGVILNFQAQGVWLGYLVGLLSAAVFLSFRFMRKSNTTPLSRCSVRK